MGIDVSEKMLARRHERQTMRRSPMCGATSRCSSCRPVPSTSSTARSRFTISKICALVEAVHRWLAAGGRFVFSMDHPVFTAPVDARWSTNEAGEKAWPVDHYFDEGQRSTDWLANGVIKQHRTLTTTLNTPDPRRLHADARRGVGADRRADRGLAGSSGEPDKAVLPAGGSAAVTRPTSGAPRRCVRRRCRIRRPTRYREFERSGQRRGGSPGRNRDRRQAA